MISLKIEQIFCINILEGNVFMEQTIIRRFTVDKIATLQEK